MIAIYSGKCRHGGPTCDGPDIVQGITRIVRVFTSSWLCVPCAVHILHPAPGNDPPALLERIDALPRFDETTKEMMRCMVQSQENVQCDAGPGTGNCPCRQHMPSYCTGSGEGYNSRVWKRPYRDTIR